MSSRKSASQQHWMLTYEALALLTNSSSDKKDILGDSIFNFLEADTNYSLSAFFECFSATSLAILENLDGAGVVGPPSPHPSATTTVSEADSI